MSALSETIGSASEDPRLEFFRCRYLVEIIDRLTYGEVVWLEKRIESALGELYEAWVHRPSHYRGAILANGFNGLWHAVYRHRRDLQRYAGGPPKVNR